MMFYHIFFPFIILFYGKCCQQVKHHIVDNQIECACKMFLKVGMLCSHVFYALQQADVEANPPQYLLNRWLKNAEKILIATDGQVSYNQNDRKNMKITDIWYEFNSCLSLAGMDEDLTEQVYSTIKELKEKLASKETNTKSSKKDFLSSVIGSQPSEVNVLPPKNSRNKGCGKRMLSSIEVSENDKKRQRLCKLCGLMCNHDSRNCPSKA